MDHIAYMIYDEFYMENLQVWICFKSIQSERLVSNEFFY